MRVDGFKKPNRLPVQQRDFAAIKNDIEIICQLVLRLGADEIEQYKSELDEMQVVANQPTYPQLRNTVDALLVFRQAIDPTPKP